MIGKSEYFSGCVRVYYETDGTYDQVTPITDFYISAEEAENVLNIGFMDIQVNHTVIFRHPVFTVQYNKKGRITGISLDYLRGNLLDTTYISQHRSS